MRLQLNGMLPAPDGRQRHITSIPGLIGAAAIEG
jgi:hypothetical protein